MEKMIAYCGLDCAKCPAYLATMENNDDKRMEIASTWSKEYNVEIKPENINCYGCTSGREPLFAHCLVCEIRKCGQEKQVKNCAHCSDYACSKVGGMLDAVPEAKVNLEEIRKTY